MGFMEWLGLEKRYEEKRYNGRGVKIFLYIKPLIAKDKDLILQLLHDSLSNYFTGISIDIHDQDIQSNTTIIKVYAPYAKFSVPLKSPIPFYSNFIRDYIKYVINNLYPRNYQLTGFQIGLLFRMSPPEIEGLSFPMPSDSEWSSGIPTFEQIKKESD